jgi:hypothetical protein
MDSRDLPYWRYACHWEWSIKRIEAVTKNDISGKRDVPEGKLTKTPGSDSMVHQSLLQYVWKRENSNALVAEDTHHITCHAGSAEINGHNRQLTIDGHMMTTQRPSRQSYNAFHITTNETKGGVPVRDTIRHGFWVIRLARS